MPSQTDNEPDAEKDAAEEKEDAKERPEDQPGCYRRYQCTHARIGCPASGKPRVPERVIFVTAASSAYGGRG
jgi:hypothetical protein